MAEAFMMVVVDVLVVIGLLVGIIDVGLLIYGCVLCIKNRPTTINAELTKVCRKLEKRIEAWREKRRQVSLKLDEQDPSRVERRARRSELGLRILTCTLFGAAIVGLVYSCFGFIQAHGNAGFCAVIFQISSIALFLVSVTAPETDQKVEQSQDDSKE